jgi:type II secretory pathway component PulF
LDFKYKAVDKKGKKLSGIVTVDTRQEAITQLKEGGLRVLELKIKTDSKFVKKIKGLNSKFSSITFKFFGGDLKKKRLESFKEELEFMGYEKMDISSITRGLTPSTFDVYKFKKDFELTEIQIEKIKSGKINKEDAINGLSTNSNKSKLKFSFGRVPLSEIVNFTEQLAILLETNVELVDSLETIQKNMTNKRLRSIVDSIIYDLTKGKELSEALSIHEDVFSPLYISMVKVGEKTGSELPQSLEDMVRFLKMKQRLKREALQASIYPGFVIFALIGVLVFMNFFIIPRLKEMFESMEFELPLLTKFIFALSEHLGLYAFGSIGVLVIAVLFITKVEYNRQRAKSFIDYISLKIPIIKTAVLTSLMYQLTLTLSITLKNGIDLAESLDLVNNVVSNKHLKKEIGEIYYSLEKGKDISDAFGDKKYMSDIVKMAVTSGEKSGKLSETLARVSVYYEQELESKLTMLTQALIPMSILFLAALIAPFIIGMYLPMISLTEQMNQIR